MRQGFDYDQSSPEIDSDLILKIYDFRAVKLLSSLASAGACICKIWPYLMKEEGISMESFTFSLTHFEKILVSLGGDQILKGSGFFFLYLFVIFII